MAGSLSMAWQRSSASAGGMLPIGSSTRRLLYPSTQVNVARDLRLLQLTPEVRAERHVALRLLTPDNLPPKGLNK